MENTDLLQNGALGTEEEKETEAVVGESSAPSGEDLYKAYQNGATLEELQDMYAAAPAQETGDLPEGGEESEDDEEPAREEVAKDAAEHQPFKVYETQEDFQKHFNHEWNKRYAGMQRKMSEQEAEVNQVRKLLAEVLGVPEETAIDELRHRSIVAGAEKAGYDNPEQYAALKKAEQEVATLRQAESERVARAAVDEIRRQGAALAQKVNQFDLDRAMENDVFRQTVFSLHKAGSPDAVERAYRAVFFEELMKQSEPRKETPVRPKEGGAAPKARHAVKPVNVAGMSREQILDMEKRILRGERIEI